MISTKNYQQASKKNFIFCLRVHSYAMGKGDSPEWRKVTAPGHAQSTIVIFACNRALTAKQMRIEAISPHGGTQRLSSMQGKAAIIVGS